MICAILSRCLRILNISHKQTFNENMPPRIPRNWPFFLQIVQALFLWNISMLNFIISTLRISNYVNVAEISYILPYYQLIKSKTQMHEFPVFCCLVLSACNNHHHILYIIYYKLFRWILRLIISFSNI